MRKVVFGIALLVLGIVIYNIFRDPPTPQTPNEYYASFDDDKLKEPSDSTDSVGVDIYIDASGSMKGYFVSSSPDFGNKLSDFYSYADNKNIYFIGNNKPYNGLIDNLITNLKGQPNGTTTYMDQLLAELCRKSSDKKLCLLVTDGIMSSGRNTNKTLHQLGNMVADSLKKYKDDKAIAVFMYSSEFVTNNDIRYYDCNDGKHEFKQPYPQRPYYVIALGGKKVIRKLKSDVESPSNKLKPLRSLFFGIHDYINHDRMDFSSSGSAIDPSKDVTLSFPLIPCLGHEVSDDYLKRNIRVVCGKDTLSLVSDSIGFRNYKLDIYNHQNVNIVIGANSFLGGKNEGKVIIYNHLIEAWSDLFCTSDTTIEKGPIAITQTYGLEELLEGIRHGFAEPDILQEFSFIINR